MRRFWSQELVGLFDAVLGGQSRRFGTNGYIRGVLSSRDASTGVITRRTG